MICPSCKHEIADGSIICPICNTQFAFTVPGLTQTSNPNLYEVVENNVNTNKNNINKEALEESAYSPNENVLPTEITHYPEEEINPDANALKYAQAASHNEEEYMKISGQEIKNEPYNPSSVVTPAIRPEAPITPSVVSIPNVTTVPVTSKNVETNNNAFDTKVETPTVMDNNGQNNLNKNNTVEQNVLNNVPSGINNNMAPNMQTTVNVLQNESPPTNKKKFKTEDLFFGGVSVVGIIILVIIVASLFTNKKNPTNPVVFRNQGNVYDQSIQETDNVGNRSNYNSPMKVGDTTLASIYDTLNQAYVDVDVTGVRFIEGTEAAELGKNYAKDPLNEGFSWYGFEYKVKFNDLKTLTTIGIEPVLNSKIYRWNGCDFITYNEKNYSLKVYNIYDGGVITNTKSATIKVVYQMPASQGEYSICFGYFEKTMGCFSKF